MSRYDNPYDAAEAAAREDDHRQARREEAEEFANEVRQRGGWAEYWASLDNPDDAYEPNDPKRSDFLDREDIGD